jgi:hypothetical protein
LNKKKASPYLEYDQDGRGCWDLLLPIYDPSEIYIGKQIRGVFCDESMNAVQSLEKSMQNIH